ncbi:MAG: hypothetical protein J5792_03415 [Bacteroidales bacterium]|nr:hypothetical protein [Bacteroidales bacterium]
MKTPDDTNDPILEECLQAMRTHGENLRRQQRLSDSIDRMVAAEKPARRPLFLYYTLSGVAACIALFFLFHRFGNIPQKLLPDAEVAQLQPVRQPQQEVPAMTEPLPRAVVPVLTEPVAGKVQTPGKELLTETAPVAMVLPADVMGAGVETTETEMAVSAVSAVSAAEEPENGNFVIAVVASHPQLASHESEVTDAVPAVRTETAETALPLPADSLPTGNPSPEIYTLHTLVSCSHPVRERKLRLPFISYGESGRASSPVTSLFGFNL